MSELAFNANGDSFDVPATVTGWRVRRMKPRGAPELVYGRDGRPLIVAIESNVDDLREAVGTAGKYRLDPVNDDGKCVEGVPPAYVQVVRLERNAADAGAAHAAPAHSDDTIREAMRLNAELARTIIENYAPTMTAAAELIRAADGAGLPARTPRVVEDEFEEDDDSDTTASAGLDVGALLGQLAPLLAPLLSSFDKGGIPSISEALDWRKATPAAKQAKAIKTPRPDGPGDVAAGPASVPENATDVLPPIDAETMAHFIAVQSALTADEAKIARAVAADLGAAELRAWFEELKKLSVPDAVAKVRALIGGSNKADGAS